MNIPSAFKKYLLFVIMQFSLMKMNSRFLQLLFSSLFSIHRIWLLQQTPKSVKTCDAMASDRLSSGWLLLCTKIPCKIPFFHSFLQQQLIPHQAHVASDPTNVSYSSPCSLSDSKANVRGGRTIMAMGRIRSRVKSRSLISSSGLFQN